MSILENAKEVADLIKKYNDQELYEKIVSLREEILELRTENLTLKQDFEDLKRRQYEASNVRFSEPFFCGSDDRNCCPHCWQSDGKLIYVIGPVRYEDTIEFTCPTCQRQYSNTSNAGWVVEDRG